MNSRLEVLIKKGYPRDLVFKLASFTDEELEYASKCAFDHISRNCTPIDSPTTIFIGGQPGCGKTVMSMNLKNEMKNIIEIGIDNYRMYHPRYLEIEKCIREFWKDKVETINDTPGNDIANFTHYFAGAMTDKLIEMGKNKKYNMILEWGMREPTAPLQTMEDLKKNDYNNIVFFVTTHKDRSYEACNLRSDLMKDSSRLIRKVPKDFHDLCVETLPDSINVIFKEGYDKKLIDYMSLVTRDGITLWDDKQSVMPGTIYENYLYNESNYEYNENNSLIAQMINIKEMIGLKNDLKSIVRVSSQALDMNFKVK